MVNLNGRHVVVTGGAGGIGSAIVRRMAGAGAKVSIFDLDAKNAGSLAATVSAEGRSAQAVVCDITDRGSVDDALKQAVAGFGDVAVLVNNAGWDRFSTFVDTSWQEWQRHFDINLIGAMHLHHAILPSMIERRYGRIVNIASDAARVGSVGSAVYSACKAALLGFSKSVARENARYGVTVNVVCPGPTSTALFESFAGGAANPEKLLDGFRRSIPLGRLGSPEDIPGAILYFASEDAGYVTGQVLSVSGGLTMVG